MAQIKNIKKPGDLIRGASVGLAGLDKDGNVVGYKAAAADAGKVLTVGEDGSVSPAEGGGGGSTLYKHNISVHSTSSPYLSFSTVIISNSSSKMNAQAVREYIKTNHPRTNASPRRHPMPCTCTVSASDGSLFISSMIEYIDDSDSVLSGMSVNLTNNTMSSGETLIAWSRFNDIVDIVTEI